MNGLKQVFVFFFRISFLLHQKRHLEDAQRRGALDGEDNGDVGVGNDGPATKKRRRSLKVKKSTPTFRTTSASTLNAENRSSPTSTPTPTNGQLESFTDVQVKMNPKIHLLLVHRR